MENWKLDSDIDDNINTLSKLVEELITQKQKSYTSNKQVELLERDLKITKENELILQYQLSLSVTNTKQLQEILTNLSSVKELNCELLKKQESDKTKMENLEKEKKEINQKLHNEIEIVKKENEDREIEIKRQYCSIQNELQAKIEKLSQELYEKNMELKEILALTERNYEEKLMKLNEDLAFAQTEIRDLRQRCAEQLSTYNVNKNMNWKSHTNSNVVRPVQLERFPILPKTDVSRTIAVCNPNVNLQTVNEQNESNTLTIKRISLTTNKKRKLFVPGNDFDEI